MRTARVEEFQEAGDRVKSILGCTEIPVSHFAADLFKDVLESIKLRNDQKKDA
jgi:hypothetical protein